MNGKITKVVFPPADKLGPVPALPPTVPRGWDYEPASEEAEVSIPPGEILPSSIDAESSRAYIWEHAAAAAAVVRSIWNEGAEGSGSLAGMSSAQVVAAFFIAVGEEVGVRVLGGLDRSEAVAVGRAIAELHAVAHQTTQAALEMVRTRIESGAYFEHGGGAYAQTLLGAVGMSGWAERVIAENPHARSDEMTESTSGFYLLEKIEPDQIAPFLSHEHPQTIALILSQLDATQASGILARLPQHLRADVTYRIACMKSVSPTVLKDVEAYVEASLCEIFSSARDVGGPKFIADMLNLVGSDMGKNILGQIDDRDPALGESVRNLIFVFDEIRKLTDREIQILMREIDQKDLVVALKGTSDEFKERFLNNMSEEVRDLITEEMEFIGPMRLAEVEEVQLRIVKQVRHLEEEGQITIRRGDDDTFV